MKKYLLFIMVILIVGLLISGCANKSPSQNDTDTNAISGSILATGSSALQPLAEQAAELFMQQNNKASVQVQGGGSGTGLNQVASGASDIGNSDVYAEEKLPEDQAKKLVDHKVCVIGFAAVTNKDVGVDNLTSEQLINIFTGKVKNWKEVGGADVDVVILNRPKSSGTRATFKKYALDNQQEAEGKALTQESSGAIKKAIADTPGSISYLALSYLSGDVNVLKYEGVAPTVDNIVSGKYPIWSYEHMYTKGEATGVAKAYIDFVMSDSFKSYIQELGYIPNSDMKVSR